MRGRQGRHEWKYVLPCMREIVQLNLLKTRWRRRNEKMKNKIKIITTKKDEEKSWKRMFLAFLINSQIYRFKVLLLGLNSAKDIHKKWKGMLPSLWKDELPNPCQNRLALKGRCVIKDGLLGLILHVNSWWLYCVFWSEKCDNVSSFPSTIYVEIYMLPHVKKERLVVISEYEH